MYFDTKYTIEKGRGKTMIEMINPEKVLAKGKEQIDNAKGKWKKFKENKVLFGLFLVAIATSLLLKFREDAATGILVWMFAKTMQESNFKIVPKMPLTEKQKTRRSIWMAFFIVTPALIAQQLMVGYFGVLAMVFVGADNFLSDTGAYFFGKYMPKKWLSSLSPISPNKTWGGALFGILLSTSVCSGAYILILPRITNPIILGIDPSLIMFAFFIGACVNVRGDLWGSAQKRFAGIKDSSSDLGSHGGYFDKTDGLVWCFWFWDICFIQYSNTFATIKAILINLF